MLKLKVSCFNLCILIIFLIIFLYYHYHYSSNTNSTILKSDSQTYNHQTLIVTNDHSKVKEVFIEETIDKNEINTNNADLIAINNINKPTISAYQIKKTEQDYKNKLSWTDFINEDIEPFYNNHVIENDLSSLELTQCNSNIIKQLHKPGLSDVDYQWCKWALSPNGGKVQVGKSYGILNGPDRNKYENKNCNSVAQNRNPSCDDSWGDSLINNWRNNTIKDICSNSDNIYSYTSKINCMDSSSQARYCIFENIVLDFKKMKDISRPGSILSSSRKTGTRKWEKGFLLSDCDKNKENINYFNFYSPNMDPNHIVCDYVINETVLAFSHDDIRNLGHSMSDFMNVWTMLWLSNLTKYQKQIIFLNIDAIRQGHSYNDELYAFESHYQHGFSRILKAKHFQHSNVCFKRILMQPKPLVLYTWDGWWQPMQCTFLGPSSLFQRYNLQIRSNYNVLNKKSIMNINIKILLIIRKPKGSEKDRVIINHKELYYELTKLNTNNNIEVITKDLSELLFEEQIQLIASTSIIIGMHGAGIVNSMHMPIGTKYCCGVIEIFPTGNYMPIHGHGNMARRMGHHYERINVPAKYSTSQGTIVPAIDVIKYTKDIMYKIMNHNNTCILPDVINNPLFQ